MFGFPALMNCHFAAVVVTLLLLLLLLPARSLACSLA
jgi:hypothetical protein